ncbi:UDP-N-acetylmuramate--L-alanine ligase [Patescibacteria group bacterium]
MNIKEIKKAYFIGIKGSGMTAVAEILKNHGIEVSGSDISEKFFTDAVLRTNNINFSEYFSADNIPNDADLIIYSTAYSEKNNPEIIEARKRNVPILSYPEALGKLFEEKLGIAVCGTHGKTTTSAMLAESLKSAGVDPSAIVGSKVIGWQGSSLAGNGEYFVAEADEYQNKLQYYNPLGAVLTSVDWDHPDFFPTVQEYEKTFADFVAKIPMHGFLIFSGDDADAERISKSANCTVLSYGFSENSDYRIEKKEKKSFEIFFDSESLGEFKINQLGKHNIQNAAAAISVCHKLKLDLDKVREALKNFQGTSRRFEYIGERNGAILIDDYAHHPAEIKVTLKAAREKYPEKNIWTIFHPHTFTRTKALLEDFAQSFDDANNVIIIDIYGSAREEQGGVSSKELVDLINKYNHDKAEYIPDIRRVIDFLGNKIGENDVVISMGAGDVWRVVDKLKK